MVKTTSKEEVLSVSSTVLNLQAYSNTRIIGSRFNKLTIDTHLTGILNTECRECIHEKFKLLLGTILCHNKQIH